MKMPAPRAVGELIPSALPQIADRLLELKIRERWASIVGRDTARRTRPDAFSSGVLRVVVDNSPWLHELTLRASALTADLRAQFPEIRAVRFVLGRLQADVPDAAATPRRPTALTAVDRAEIEAATVTIADAAVAEAARRLLTTARRFPRAPAASRGAP
jgi:hypothetical protein